MLIFEINLGAMLALMSIPSAITGLFFWLIQKKITKRDTEQDKLEEARREEKYLLIQGVGAAIALGEATATSVQRHNMNCNGEMTAALEYARRVKHKHKEFLQKQGIDNLY